MVLIVQYINHRTYGWGFNSRLYGDQEEPGPLCCLFCVYQKKTTLSTKLLAKLRME